MLAWHALPSWLKRHEYKSPTSSADTPFAQGQGAPPDQTFFAWLKERPWNANEFNLFMGVHRTGVETWLDRSEVLDLLFGDLGIHERNGAASTKPSVQNGTNLAKASNANGMASNGMNSSTGVDYPEQMVFVDVGGGIGQQCMVCSIIPSVFPLGALFTMVTLPNFPRNSPPKSPLSEAKSSSKTSQASSQKPMRKTMALYPWRRISS
jgi:hypothetical protein